MICKVGSVAVIKRHAQAQMYSFFFYSVVTVECFTDVYDKFLSVVSTKYEQFQVLSIKS